MSALEADEACFSSFVEGGLVEDGLLMVEVGLFGSGVVKADLEMGKRKQVPSSRVELLEVGVLMTVGELAAVVGEDSKAFSLEEVAVAR